MTLTVETLNTQDVERWDNYVNSAPGATFFHRAGWKTVLESAFGHSTHFLYAQDDGNIVGVLPLAQIKSVLFGNSLSSLPFCVYGGIVADSEQVAAVLREEACRLAERLKGNDS